MLNKEYGVGALWWIELEFLLISLRRFVDASRDKPERGPLSGLSLLLPRSRAFAGWSMLESVFRYLYMQRRLKNFGISDRIRNPAYPASPLCGCLPR